MLHWHELWCVLLAKFLDLGVLIFGELDASSIEAQIVSRRIRQTQQKIDGRVFGTVDAESAAEWLEKNCPELGSK